MRIFSQNCGRQFIINSLPNGAELITKIANETSSPKPKQLISVKSSMAMPISNQIAEIPFTHGSVPTPNLNAINSFEEFHNWSSGSSLSASIQNGSNRLAIFSLQDNLIVGSPDSFATEFSSTTSIFDPNSNFALK